MKLSNTAMLMLKVLEDGEMHGYAIAKHLEELTQGDIQLGEAVIYPALRLLERKDLVVGTWETPATGLPRKMYQLTPKGQHELTARGPALGRASAALAALFGGHSV